MTAEVPTALLAYCACWLLVGWLVGWLVGCWLLVAGWSGSHAVELGFFFADTIIVTDTIIAADAIIATDTIIAADTIIAQDTIIAPDTNRIKQVDIIQTTIARCIFADTIIATFTTYCEQVSESCGYNNILGYYTSRE